MLTEEQIKLALKDRNLKAVARNAGVSYFALHRWIRCGNELPSFRLVSGVSDYLVAQQAEIEAAKGGENG